MVSAPARNMNRIPSVFYLDASVKYEFMQSDVRERGPVGPLAHFASPPPAFRLD